MGLYNVVVKNLSIVPDQGDGGGTLGRGDNPHGPVDTFTRTPTYLPSFSWPGDLDGENSSPSSAVRSFPFITFRLGSDVFPRSWVAPSPPQGVGVVLTHQFLDFDLKLFWLSSPIHVLPPPKLGFSSHP